MTRKDYIQFAALWLDTLPDRDCCEGDTHFMVMHNQWRYLIEKQCELFEFDNYKFNRSVFLKACGYA